MDEQKKETEGKEQEAPPKDSGERSEPETGNYLDKVDAAAERLEEQNKRYEENLRKGEDLYARMRLGGKTDAGEQTQKTTDPDEELQKELKQIW